MTTRPPSEHAAHRYADAGWPVFPCRPGSKVPATEHGFHDAATSHRQITRWWSAQPEANLAIATGHPAPTSSTSTSRTAAQDTPPSPRPGGAHLYYRGTSQRSGTIPAAALDFRGQGGYVLAPPSLSAETGRPYEVISHQPSDATVNWEAIRQHLTPANEHQPPARPGPEATERPREVEHLAAWMAAQPEGNRNAALFWASARACEAGDYNALTAIARAARETGLPDREITATIRSARRTAGRPFEPAPQREAG